MVERVGCPFKIFAAVLLPAAVQVETGAKALT